MWLDVLFLVKKRNDSNILGQHKKEYESSNLGGGSMIFTKYVRKSKEVWGRESIIILIYCHIFKIIVWDRAKDDGSLIYGWGSICQHVLCASLQKDFVCVMPNHIDYYLITTINDINTV